MTAIQGVAALLDQKWEPKASNVDGRTIDVPKPEILMQKEKFKKRLRTKDVARVVDGGDGEVTPKGFGWTHKGTRSVVTIELRTADRGAHGSAGDGRVRLFGKRDGIQPGENYGGLVGEVSHILELNRKGFGGYDRVEYGPIRDQSTLVGGGFFRCDVDVALVQYAQQQVQL